MVCHGPLPRAERPRSVAGTFPECSRSVPGTFPERKTKLPERNVSQEVVYTLLPGSKKATSRNEFPQRFFARGRAARSSASSGTGKHRDGEAPGQENPGRGRPGRGSAGTGQSGTGKSGTGKAGTGKAGTGKIRDGQGRDGEKPKLVLDTRCPEPGLSGHRVSKKLVSRKFPSRGPSWHPPGPC